MTYALLPGLADSLSLTFSQVGLLRAANRTSTAALQIPAGLLAEHVGAARLLVFGTCVAGVGLIGLATWANSFVSILIGLVIVGAGNAVQHPLSSTLISEAFDGPGRRRALGIYNAYGDAGKFAFMGAVILALSAGLEWRTPLFWFGIIALAVAFVIHRSLVSSQLSHRVGVQIGQPPVAHDATSTTLRGWGVRSGRGVAALCVVASLDSSTRIAFLTFVAFAMMEKGLSVSLSSLAVLITVFGGMFGKYICGVAAERFGVVRTIALTEALTAAGIVAIVVLPHQVAFVVLPVLGVVLNGTSSVTYGTVAELVEERRHARAYAFIYTQGSVCGLASPLLFGLLADATSIELTLYAVAFAVSVTLLVLPVLGVELRRLAGATS